MAEEDGYEVMRKVRELPPEQGGLVPAIALTGYATRKDRERALAAGYQLHLAKPVEPEDLVAAIADALGAMITDALAGPSCSSVSACCCTWT